ncbi:hypothetical protein [Cyanobium sp. ATX 6F1]|uniref:hypothetical protein n=1 Tax=unclassified Cyanobium TaxID=2627006 RepID=UPI0020CBB189|nr:hypothetical protein [Cyanobium sp. ATX 6F1]MCP9915010.1 hypothetical protein [Cyanobium sp. ATX 6F1]
MVSSVDSPSVDPKLSPAARISTAFSGMGSVADRVIASELRHRDQTSEALSMMVSSMVRMVQAGKTSNGRWSTS